MKTEVAKTSLVFLGHNIKDGCISSDENNVSKILEIRQPQTKRQVRQIIGLVKYYHEFVPNYLELLSPLTDCLKGGPSQRKIKWSLECQKTVMKIQDMFSTKLALLTPNLKHPFVLATDCSAYGYGFCLKQYMGTTLYHVFYISNTLTPSEMNMSTVEKELHTLALGILRYKKYLLGAPFTVEVEHKPLEYLQTKQIMNPELLRILLQIQEYTFNIKSILDSENIIADFLSRY